MPHALSALACFAALAIAPSICPAAPASDPAGPSAPPVLAGAADAGPRWSARAVRIGDACEITLQRADSSSPVLVRTTDASRGIASSVQPDGHGGAWLAWTEIDYLATTTDVRAAHVDAAGEVIAGGREALASFLDLFDGVALLPDGRGGAWLAWREADATHERRLRINRLDARGRVAAGWPAGGLELAGSSGACHPRLAPDGHGGALLTADPDPNREGGAPLALRVDADAPLVR